MKNFASLVALGTLATFAAAPAWAVTILQFDPLASTSNPTLAASNEAPGVTGVDMSAGSGLTANSGSTWNWKNWGNGSSSFATAADAITGGDFWTWGFSSTNAWDLSSFDIRLDRSSTGPNQFDLSLSVNSGAFASVLSHDFGDADLGVDFLAVDLSSYGSVTSATFRMAAYGEDTGGWSSAGTFDLEPFGVDTAGFILSGDVSAAVPLPAGLPLALTGFGALALLRRRKPKT